MDGIVLIFGASLPNPLAPAAAYLDLEWWRWAFEWRPIGRAWPWPLDGSLMDYVTGRAAR